MEPLGVDLKAAREKQEISLREISVATRISLRHFENIEEGRYKDLPGGMYNRAFLRAYCEYIGLDPAPYLERFELETAPPREKTPKPGKKTQLLDERRGLHPLVIWSSMLVLSIVGLYLSRDWIAGVFSPYFAQPPAASMVASPSAEPASPNPPPPAQSLVPASSPASDTAATLSLDFPEPAGPEEIGESGEADEATIRIQFQVLEKCWVSVNSDGNRVLVKLLEPGDTQSFDASDRFYVILGNAGGIRMKINGMQTKPLGRPGEVVRLLINSQNLQDLVEGATG